MACLDGNEQPIKLLLHPLSQDSWSLAPIYEPGHAQQPTKRPLYVSKRPLVGRFSVTHLGACCLPSAGPAVSERERNREKSMGDSRWLQWKLARLILVSFCLALCLRRWRPGAVGPPLHQHSPVAGGRGSGEKSASLTSCTKIDGNVLLILLFCRPDLMREVTGRVIRMREGERAACRGATGGGSDRRPGAVAAASRSARGGGGGKQGRYRRQRRRVASKGARGGGGSERPAGALGVAAGRGREE